MCQVCRQSLWKLRIRAVLPVFLPEENEIEGRLVSGIKILPADNLEKTLRISERR